MPEALKRIIDMIHYLPGIGEKTMQTLIQHFKSVKRLKLASEKEISEVVGLSKAKKITDFYKTQKWCFIKEDNQIKVK